MTTPSIHELIAIALRDPESDEAADAVASLQERGDAEVWEAAAALCARDDATAREIGARIIGQNVVHAKTFGEEAVSFLLAMLERETDPTVLSTLGFMLGHLKSPRAIAPLVALKDHPHEDVRYGVAFGLGGHEDERAIRTLIELSADTDDGVRNWATFGLGDLITADSPQMREAFYRRLDDPHDETRFEALYGLVLRGDQGIIERLNREGRIDEVGPLLVRAASEYPARAFVRLLQGLRPYWHGDQLLLDEAMSRCAMAVFDAETDK